MELRIEHPANFPSAAIMYVNGNVDGSNYQELVKQGQTLYAAGVRHIALELSQCDYMSSSGLVALNIITKLLRAESLPDIENGWATLKMLDDARAARGKAQLALVNPTLRVQRVLDLAGLTTLLPIYPDTVSALAALA